MAKKKPEPDHLRVISDLAEAIVMGDDPMPVVLKHKAVIDQAFAHVIAEDMEPFDWTAFEEEAAKRGKR